MESQTVKFKPYGWICLLLLSVTAALAWRLTCIEPSDSVLIDNTGSYSLQNLRVWANKQPVLIPSISGHSSRVVC